MISHFVMVLQTLYCNIQCTDNLRWCVCCSYVGVSQRHQWRQHLWHQLVTKVISVTSASQLTLVISLSVSYSTFGPHGWSRLVSQFMKGGEGCSLILLHFVSYKQIAGLISPVAFCCVIMCAVGMLYIAVQCCAWLVCVLSNKFTILTI